MHTEGPRVEAVRRALPRTLPFANFKLAALAAAVVVYLSVLVATAVIPLLAQSLTPWRSAAFAVGLVVVVPMCTWSARVIRRFCGRLVPVSLSGEQMFAPAIACVGGSVLAGVSSLNSLRRLATTGSVSAWFESGGYELAFAGTWCIALAIQSGQYWWWRRPPKQPYILYLRTFLGFSDRATMAALFTIAGGRERVVVLTAPASNSASWDPILIAFRGNPLLRLSASSPMFVSVPDREWETAVRHLAEQASQVVIDVSDLSPGIRAEIEIVGEERISPKVIWLSESSNADRLHEVQSLISRSHIPADRLVFYTRSWSAALPNLLIGACITALTFFVVPIAASGGSFELPQLSRWAEFVGYLIGRSGPAVLFFAIVFVRPAVDRPARKALRALLTGA